MRVDYWKCILAAGSGVVLSACSSFSQETSADAGMKDISASQAIHALASSPVCCTSFSQIAFEQINNPGMYDYVISGESEAVELSSGKTFVKGVALPENVNGDLKVKIISPIGSSVFVPNVMLLDKNYAPVTSYGRETIGFDSGSLFNIDRYVGEFHIAADQAESVLAKYLLIYTTEKDLNDTTTLEALDQGTVRVGRQNEPRMYSDQVVAHSPVGEVRLVFKYSAKSRVAIVANDSPVISHSEPKVDNGLTASGETQIKPPVSGQEIQAETEVMYIRLIEQAVRANKLNKAIKFVEEGEKAGSSKVRDAFFEALKKYQ